MPYSKFSYEEVKTKKSSISLNTLTYEKDMIEHQAKLKSLEIDLDQKWDLCEFYGSKTLVYFQLSPEFIQLLIDTITLHFSSQTKFLSLHRIEVILGVCLNIFHDENAELKQNERYYLFVLKFILQYVNDENTKSEVLDTLYNLFESTTNIHTKMVIADIMFLNGLDDIGYDMLHYIRHQENEMEMNTRPDIASDSQNVHNSEINQSVLRCSVRLIEIYQTNDLDEEVIIAHLGNSIESSLERLKDDPTLFRYDNDDEEIHVSFNLSTVLANAWTFIQQHPHREELQTILTEHLTDAFEYCSTGYLARIISSIQGFSDDPKLQITISEKERLKPIVNRRVDEIVRNMPQDILDNMIDTDNTIFVQFILDHLDLVEFTIENKEDVLNVLKYYCQNDNLVWKDDKIEIVR